MELIALHDTQQAKNQGLADAVRLNRLDLVELLVSLGADIKAVPFSDVLLNWHPHIIRFFIDHGADCKPEVLAWAELHSKLEQMCPPLQIIIEQSR